MRGHTCGYEPRPFHCLSRALLSISMHTQHAYMVSHTLYVVLITRYGVIMINRISCWSHAEKVGNWSNCVAWSLSIAFARLYLLKSLVTSEFYRLTKWRCSMHSVEFAVIIRMHCYGSYFTERIHIDKKASASGYFMHALAKMKDDKLQIQ